VPWIEQSFGYGLQAHLVASELLREYDKDRVQLFLVGRKGVQFFRRRGFHVASDVALLEDPDFEERRRWVGRGKREKPVRLLRLER